MRALIVGGTGLISTGIVKHLLARGAQVTMFNRGKRERAPAVATGDVREIHGDRNDFAAFERQFADARFDVVIDMICFSPEQAQSAVRAFGGRCEHFVFCSTVCTYGVKVPPNVLVDETFSQEPISDYGRNKLACERLFEGAHAEGKFNVTIVRPSHTYGPGYPLLDHLEPDALSWDRVERGLPVLCGGDGLGLWVATHRDDCGKLFAYAAMNRKTYGQAYNATRDPVFTWRDYYRQAAAALGRTARVLFMPAAWIVQHEPKRFGLLREIMQYHGAYTSAKAKRDVPEFQCEIDFAEGAAGTLADLRRRSAWRDGAGDSLYNAMVSKALNAGVEPLEL